MLLIETNQVDADLLPIAELRDHLRLGTGFAEDDLQDAVLEGFLRAAIAAIEGRTNQALLQRDFVWTLETWADADRQRVPLTPIRYLDGVQVYASDDSVTAYDGGEFGISADSYFPDLFRISGTLPTIPDQGRAEIRLTAGAATEWGGVPADLRQAVLMLAAHYYEYRNDTGLARGCMPFGVTALIERYRPLRLGRGVRG